MTASVVCFVLAESGKERMRRASIELGARILRSARMSAAAEALDTLGPLPVVKSSLARGTRDVQVLVSDWNVIARSSRRAGLRYAARVLDGSRFRYLHRFAIAYLIGAADEIAEGGLGRSRRVGR